MAGRCGHPRGAISAFGSGIACSVGASRLLFAMGRDGLFSQRLGEISDRGGVPRRALSAILVVSRSRSS
ncbi:APC family permease [Streptomyces coffeae]|uniref:APC family permease n=1 Tax=Streptomyces coffeae TaxID=621382 RepID=A0ABS1NNR1_9ACTN|nr:APC family permease [Streptomyces coffeae]